jgi:hypothetical protein
MQRDLHAMMINREKRRARVGANPGCSAQSRYSFLRRPLINVAFSFVREVADLSGFFYS